jgi:hypothetical protein
MRQRRLSSMSFCRVRVFVGIPREKLHCGAVMLLPAVHARIGAKRAQCEQRRALEAPLVLAALPLLCVHWAPSDHNAVDVDVV